MKKKLLILSASIGLILACFPFILCAEEDPESDLGVDPPLEVYQLDNYFYSNYDLLPYIESDGSQYIDTSIPADNNLLVHIKVSDLEQYNNNSSSFIFGTGQGTAGNSYSLAYNFSNSAYRLFFYNQNSTYSLQITPYTIYDVVYDKNKVYLNNSLIHTFTDTSFSYSNPIYIFSVNNSYSNQRSVCKLYHFSIYDYDSEEYVKYYYPAKSKSGDVIGLYDSISKTFITTGTASPFANPTDDKVLHFQIGDFISAGLGWIEDILDFAIAEPLIICFMAIGLAGAMFRWGRRLVHF